VDERGGECGEVQCIIGCIKFLRLCVRYGWPAVKFLSLAVDSDLRFEFWTGLSTLGIE
jgi:hypothetical protein